MQSLLSAGRAPTSQIRRQIISVLTLSEHDTCMHMLDNLMAPISAVASAEAKRVSQIQGYYAAAARQCIAPKINLTLVIQNDSHWYDISIPKRAYPTYLAYLVHYPWCRSAELFKTGEHCHVRDEQISGSLICCARSGIAEVGR